MRRNRFGNIGWECRQYGDGSTLENRELRAMVGKPEMSIYPLLIERIARNNTRIENQKAKRGCLVDAFHFFYWSRFYEVVHPFRGITTSEIQPMSWSPNPLIKETIYQRSEQNLVYAEPITQTVTRRTRNPVVIAV